jgi:peptide/nickel transport system substrate-binding protein
MLTEEKYMYRNRIMAVLAILLVASLVLSACQSATPAETEAPTEEQADTETPTEEEMPAEEMAPATTRHGGWLDEVVMTVVDVDQAVTQITAGAIDVYAGNLATPAQLEPVAEAGLNRSLKYGLYYELTFNPATFNDGTFNPFAIPEIREAMNWLIDREYIVQEVYGGNAIAKWFPITAGFPDYAKYVDIARPLEAEYSYDFDRANAAISDAMTAAGGELVDGVWNVGGEPVSVTLLIRNDSDGTRIPIGDYTANQLNAVGFDTISQYGTSGELSVYWIQGDPADGGWGVYTGAWSTPAVSRDQGPGYNQMYAYDGAMSFTQLWQSYEPQTSAEFHDALDCLLNACYTNEEERREQFAIAMRDQFPSSFRIFLVDGLSGEPWDTDVSVAYDLASGIETSALTPFTIRFADQEGGTLTWGDSSLFVDPSNPVGGSNWAYDAMWQNYTQDYGILLNPHTGVALPQRIDHADVTVTTGLPVSQTYDWVNLSFEDEITVPADAWIDWDPETETFITVGDAYPDGLTATVKSVAYYPAELYDTTWHDGSAFSAADIVMNMIMGFATGTPGSSIYDASVEGTLDSFKASFKGFKIASTDPLTIEYYTDVWQLDAENNVTTLYPTTFGYGYGIGAWHNIAVSNLAEADETLAYTTAKADELGVEWMNFIAGPSLEVLAGYLDQAAADNYIPFAATMGDYVTADEAAARYANLASFYADHGHFWIGTGPYILDQVLSVENQAVLVNNENYIDLADKWAGFATPKLATVEIDGSARVTIGDEATFDVFVTDPDGAPYPLDEITFVKYLVYDATGALVEVGAADADMDGHYTVTLSSDLTSSLDAGANTLEIAVAPIPVSIPSFGTFEFVTE